MIWKSFVSDSLTAGGMVRLPASWKVAAAAFLFLSAAGSYTRAATTSPLFSRGYTVIPSPQKVSLGEKEFEFAGGCRSGTHKRRRSERYCRQKSAPATTGTVWDCAQDRPASGKVVRLAIAVGAVVPAGTAERNTAALGDQAYRLELAGNRISITGNTPIGLFYGVQTLVQLLKPESGKLFLPAGEIQDWPDLELRVIYWDDAHHLDHLDVLKEALRNASFYKINAVLLKLEGHFNMSMRNQLSSPTH